jgi:hypothetical protein
VEKEARGKGKDREKVEGCVEVLEKEEWTK